MAVFCDTHAHLDFEPFDADREAAIERASAIGLRFIVNISIDIESSHKSLALARQYPGFIFSTIGIHPNYSQDIDETTFREIGKLAGNQEVVAIGEIGLDYYRDYATPQQQINALEVQLELAKRLELPVVIHERASAQDLVPFLVSWHKNLPNNSRLKLNPGVMHAFSADLTYVEPLLDCGFCFGIGGPVTYKNAVEKRELVSVLPLKNLLLETDCPFMPPQSHRGQRNEPSFIPLIAQKIAELRGLSLEEVGGQLTSNARRVFQIAHS